MDDYAGKVVLETEIDTSGFEEGLEEIEKTDTPKIEVVSDKNSKVFQKILSLTSQIGKKFTGISVASAKFLLNIGKLVTSLGFVGGILGAVLLVAFGIGKAFQKAIEKDEQLTTKIKYLKFVISEGFAKLFATVGEGLVKAVNWLIDKLLNVMALIGLIAKKLFKVDMFSEATAEAFAKTQKSANGIKKSLAGFDEMEVINESGGLGISADIYSALEGLKTMDERAEEVGQKIKNYFTFPTKEELSQYASEMEETVWMPIGGFFNKYFMQPYNQTFYTLKETSRPMWMPFYLEAENVFKQVKSLFQPFIDFVNEKLIAPISNTLSTWGSDFKKRYATFINKLIYGLNIFLSAFGIQLDYIDEEGSDTADDLKENFNKTMEAINKDAEKTRDTFGQLYDKLKELAGKTWNIVTNFATNTPSKGTVNSWLQPLRESLSKVGINIPYFAKGGIVNLPSRGVPIGGAFAGESGAEGVIPLTDSQQMETLGEAIGRHINFTATIPVYAYNRVIDRKVERVRAENNFASNR